MTVPSSDTHSEVSPLLEPPLSSPPSLVSRKIHRRVLILVLVGLLSLEMGDFITTAPLIRIFETITCYKWYSKHDTSVIGPGGIISEKLCKIEPVQSEVALLEGYSRFFDAVPGKKTPSVAVLANAFFGATTYLLTLALVLSIPYGLLADNYGRKPVLYLGFLGVILGGIWQLSVLWFWQTLSIRLVWLNGAFLIIGGGGPVISAIIYTLLADVVPEEER
jgi:MFS family permease